MMNIGYAYDRDAIKMDDFLKIEDEELKKYIFVKVEWKEIHGNFIR